MRRTSHPSIRSTDMSKQKPAAIALGTALAGFALAGSSFAMEPLAQGYMLAAGDAKAQEGKYGDGKCGLENADTDAAGPVSQVEFLAADPDEAVLFPRMDANQHGYTDEAERKAYHEGQPEAAPEKKAGEGKCAEGGCGG